MESLSSPGAQAEAIEQRITSLYSAMLHQPDIKTDDNFLHLGGHSLTAAQLLARVRAEFGVNISLRDFFADPTPAALVVALTMAGAEKNGTEAAGAEKYSTEAARAEKYSTEAAPGERVAQRISLDALDSEDNGTCLPPVRGLGNGI